jgi:hypothetical protein
MWATMSNTANGGERALLRAKRIQYLREHPEILGLGDAIICKKLKDAGLVSKYTYYLDMRISELVKEAKRSA